MRTVLAVFAAVLLSAAPASAQSAARVAFAHNEISLAPAVQAQLDTIATDMALRDGALILAGHTDASERDGVVLSNRRAGAVRDYLVARGVSASRITTLGYCSERPLIGGAQPAQNRRVEINVGPASGW